MKKRYYWCLFLHEAKNFKTIMPVIKRKLEKQLDELLRFIKKNELIGIRRQHKLQEKN